MVLLWNNETKWVKTRIEPKDYKVIRKLAIDKEVSLAELLRQALKLLINEMKGGDDT